MLLSERADFAGRPRADRLRTIDAEPYQGNGKSEDLFLIRPTIVELILIDGEYP
jgi:hypothetical protein